MQNHRMSILREQEAKPRGMGHEKFPGELKYTSYRILRAEMYETTTNVRYDVLRGGWGYIKCRYLISGSDAV